ncbi:DUF3990 domain-containing protein [Lachnoclostridium phytofermentans]|uniref:DUF3990 domain-containing protein n=1 Tax=Lachnoclostridium phytofermentans TaxID=66219 RepID=UPI0012DDF874|nr:DUF3990 domain-containing protein [Lachnoclostridium phytofermentans]
MGSKKGSLKCYIYAYQVNKNEMNGLNILELLNYDEEWVNIITKSRIDGEYPDYDIIYDRIADNRYQDISEILIKYKNKSVPFTSVIDKIKWNKDKGDQFCFRSKSSLKCLELIQKFDFKKEDGIWKMEA